MVRALNLTAQNADKTVVMVTRVKFKLYSSDGARSRLEFQLGRSEAYYVGAHLPPQELELTFGVKNPRFSFGHFLLRRAPDAEGLREYDVCFRIDPARYGKVRLNGAPLTTELDIRVSPDDHMIFETEGGAFRLEFLKISQTQSSADPGGVTGTHSKRIKRPKAHGRRPDANPLAASGPEKGAQASGVSRASRASPTNDESHRHVIVGAREMIRAEAGDLAKTPETPEPSRFTKTISKLSVQARGALAPRAVLYEYDEATGLTRKKVNPRFALGVVTVLIAAVLYGPSLLNSRPDSNRAPAAQARSLPSGFSKQREADTVYYPIGQRAGETADQRRPEQIEAEVASAVKAGALDLLMPLFAQYSINPNAKLSDGMPLLSLAAQNNQVQIAHFLLQKGALVNAVGANGMTPLMFAVQAGSLEMTRALLDAGADTTVRRDDGQTAVHLASAVGKISIIDLLSHGPESAAKKSTDRLPASTSTHEPSNSKK